MNKTAKVAAVAVALGLSTGGQATIYTFNASLSQANEVPAVPPAVPIPSSATGLATLSYNDNGTASLADDTMNFAMSVFGLTGVATAFHIHGAATTSENAAVRVGLDAAPFINLNVGGNLLVGGNNVPAPTTLFVTAADPARPNAGHGGATGLSLLEMLQQHLAYANVHTAANGGGEVRGQLLQVGVVPEPETYALMLAGLGLVGGLALRRRRLGV